MDQDASPKFSIILRTVSEDGETLDELCHRFSDTFHLQEELSRELLELPPVLLFSELDRGQVSDVKPPLKSLSEEFDVQFLITSEETSSMPELTWPEHPDFESVDEDTVFQDVEFERRDGSLVCPKCDYIIVLDQSGDRVSGSVLIQSADEESAHDQEEEQESEEETVSMEEEALASDSDTADSDSDTDLSDLDDLLDEETEEDEGTSSDKEDEEEPEQEQEQETSEEETEDEQQDEAEENTPAVEANGSTNVFISGMPDAETEEVVELLAHIRGCSVSEAQDLMDRPITPIMNGVTDDVASELKEQFNDIGVKVNIVSK